MTHPELRIAGSPQDPVPLVAALAPAGARVCSLDPTGDSGLALLLAGAAEVVVGVDDAASSALVHLKLAALRALPPQSVRSLLGAGAPGRRVWFYHHVRGALPPEARAWWDAHEGLVREGILDGGRWERILSRYRRAVLPRALPAGAVDSLLDGRGPDAIAPFRSPVWALATRAALHPRWRRWSGVSAQADADQPVDGRVRRAMERGRPGDNPLLVRLLRGWSPDPELGPPYLTASGHARLQPLLDRLTVRRLGGDAPLPEGLDAVDLALLPDEIDGPARGRLLDAAARALVPGGRVWGAWWGGSPGWGLPDASFRPHPDATRLDALDRSPFTGGFVAGARR